MLMTFLEPAVKDTVNVIVDITVNIKIGITVTVNVTITITVTVTVTVNCPFRASEKVGSSNPFQNAPIQQTPTLYIDITREPIYCLLNELTMYP